MIVNQGNFSAYVTSKYDYQSNSKYLEYGSFIYFYGNCQKLNYSISGFSASLARRYDAKCNIKFVSKSENNNSILNKFRNKIINLIYKNSSSSFSADLILSMTFGLESLISDESYDQFKKTGLAHLLVVSGMHLSILFMFMSSIIKKVLFTSIIFIRRFGHLYLPEIISYMLVLFYINLIGFEPAAIRALIALTLVLIAKILNRELNLINNIIASLLIMNFFYPFILVEPGVQLTFATLIGIYISSFLKANIVNYFIASFIISFSSSVVTYFWFGSFSLYGFILNPIVAPILGVVTCQIALVIVFLGLIGFPVFINYLGMFLEGFYLLINKL